MATSSRRLIGAELTLSILIIVTLIAQRDSGWDAIPIVCFYRLPLQIILIILLIFHAISVLRRREVPIGQFLLKIMYLVVVIFVLISSFLFQDDIMYAQEIVYFHLNANWFNQIVSDAPHLSHCSIPTENSCWEIISLQQENRLDSHDVTVASYHETLAVIVDNKQSVYYYVHLSGQSKLPQVSLGRYKNVECDYRLSETWFVCAIGH